MGSVSDGPAPATGPSHAGGSDGRKAYQSPVLQDYGKVRQLTQTNPGTGTDGGGIDDPTDDSAS